MDELTDVSRISSGRLDLNKTPVALSAVLSSALDSSRVLMDKMGHEFNYIPCPETLTVYADPARLAQVFVNLLNNAAKYTPKGGKVRLSVERQGNEAVVTIRDTGIGISPDALPYIFDMFTQVKPSSELSQGGLGIGLSLVKRLVELHGGTVEGRSAGEGAGAEFIVRLGLAMPTSRPDGVASSAPDSEDIADALCEPAPTMRECRRGLAVLSDRAYARPPARSVPSPHQAFGRVASRECDMKTGLLGIFADYESAELARRYCW